MSYVESELQQRACVVCRMHPGNTSDVHVGESTFAPGRSSLWHADASSGRSSLWHVDASLLTSKESTPGSGIAADTGVYNGSIQGESNIHPRAALITYASMIKAVEPAYLERAFGSYATSDLRVREFF